MSKTTRRYISGPGRDGQQDWTTRIPRDNRAMGLRDHKRDRRAARVSLKSGDGDALPGGKAPPLQ